VSHIIWLRNRELDAAMSDILVVGARGIPNVEGGAEKNAEIVFPLLVQSGYSVRLLGIKSHIKGDEYKGVQLTGLPTINILKTDKLVYNIFALLYAVVSRPRVVHLQCLNSALFLALYKIAGLKVVMRYGSSDYEFDKWGFVHRLMLKFCEYQTRYADHVITVSQRFRSSLIERHGLSHVTVIPNGLDPVSVSKSATRYYEELGLSGTRYVLSVGRITADKDFETLVKAVRGIEDKSVRLVVAGGAEPGYGEKFFNDADPRIMFIGRIDRDLLAALYQNCSVFVNSSRHEGLSNAILEAVSYHRALIVSNIPANLEMEFPEHNYFPVGDWKALRQKINCVLRSGEKYICSDEKFVKWPQVCAHTLAIYEEIAPEYFSPQPQSKRV